MTHDRTTEAALAALALRQSRNVSATFARLDKQLAALSTTLERCGRSGGFTVDVRADFERLQRTTEREVSRVLGPTKDRR